MSVDLIRILKMTGVHPVLMDIGASGDVPENWVPIAGESFYVGFDPDLRELHTHDDGPFLRSWTVNKAVSVDDRSPIRFFLTRSPYCSSALQPDETALSEYLFAPLFEIEREVEVAAVSIPRALADIGLDRVHWFKADTQGTDLQLYRSIPDKVRHGVLAVDVEPGLMDTYIGEDLFPETHRHLLAEGFWVSRLNVAGSVRKDVISMSEQGDRNRDVTLSNIETGCRSSPVWCEARYLRTLEWMAAMTRPREDYGVLWVFAMLDGQLGFALDVATQCEKRFGCDALTLGMLSEASRALVTVVKAVDRRKSGEQHWARRLWRWMVPRSLRTRVRACLAG